MSITDPPEKVNPRRLTQADLVDMIGRARDLRKAYEATEEVLKAELARRYGEDVKYQTQLDPENYKGRRFTTARYEIILSWLEKLILDTGKVRDYLGKRIGQFEKPSNHFQVEVNGRPTGESNG